MIGRLNEIYVPTNIKWIPPQTDSAGYLNEQQKKRKDLSHLQYF